MPSAKNDGSTVHVHGLPALLPRKSFNATLLVKPLTITFVGVSGMDPDVFVL